MTDKAAAANERVLGTGQGNSAGWADNPAAASRDDSLREVTVNGVRFFNSDDVERWHRDLVAASNRSSAFEEERDELHEFVQKTYVRFKERMPDDWLSEAEMLLATTGRDDA